MTSLVPLSAIIPFFIASLAIELTPGPNMAYLALVGVQKGRVTGLFATAGVALGLFIIGALAALGFAVLVAENRLLYEVLRWGGVLYLLWLALDTWREAVAPLEHTTEDDAHWGFFRRGLITNLLNPKAFLFYVSVLPNFTDPGAVFWSQALVLTLIYVSAATLVHLSIVLGAGGASKLFQVSKFRQVLGGFFAFLLVVVAIWLAFKTGWQT